MTTTPPKSDATSQIFKNLTETWLGRDLEKRVEAKYARAVWDRDRIGILSRMTVSAFLQGLNWNTPTQRRWRRQHPWRSRIGLMLAFAGWGYLVYRFMSPPKQMADLINL